MLFPFKLLGRAQPHIMLFIDNRINKSHKDTLNNQNK